MLLKLLDGGRGREVRAPPRKKVRSMATALSVPKAFGCKLFFLKNNVLCKL
jgi:hypothetical protein